jgi:hypothetical protein
VFQYELAVQAAATVGLASLDTMLGTALDVAVPASPAASSSDLVERLLSWTTAVLQRARHPVLEPARVLKQLPGPPAVFVVAQPCLHPAATHEVVQTLVGLLNRAAQPSQAPTAW